MESPWAIHRPCVSDLSFWCRAGAPSKPQFDTWRCSAIGDSCSQFRTCEAAGTAKSQGCLKSRPLSAMPPATQRSCTAEARGYRVDLKDALPRRPATRRLKDELKLLRGRAKYALQPRPSSLKIFVLGTGRSGPRTEARRV